MAEEQVKPMEEAKPEAKPAETTEKTAKKKILKPASEALIPLEDTKKEAPKPKETQAEQSSAVPSRNLISDRVSKSEKKHKFNFLMFGKWSTDFQVMDLGLKPYINLAPYYVPLTAGRSIKKQFWKSRKSIVERLMGKLLVAGHKGKKHVWTSGVQGGKLTTIYNAVKKTFEIIEAKTKKNPIEVYVRALETGSPKEGVATIEFGGVRYPKSADLAPQRRIDLALRWMTQGSFMGSRKNKKHIWDALADEIIATANNDQQKSYCLTKRQELERQAAASR